MSATRGVPSTDVQRNVRRINGLNYEALRPSRVGVLAEDRLLADGYTHLLRAELQPVMYVAPDGRLRIVRASRDPKVQSVVLFVVRDVLGRCEAGSLVYPGCQRVMHEWQWYDGHGTCLEGRVTDGYVFRVDPALLQPLLDVSKLKQKLREVYGLAPAPAPRRPASMSAHATTFQAASVSPPQRPATQAPMPIPMPIPVPLPEPVSLLPQPQPQSAPAPQPAPQPQPLATPACLQPVPRFHLEALAKGYSMAQWRDAEMQWRPEARRAWFIEPECAVCANEDVPLAVLACRHACACMPCLVASHVKGHAGCPMCRAPTVVVRMFDRHNHA